MCNKITHTTNGYCKISPSLPLNFGLVEYVHVIFCVAAGNLGLSGSLAGFHKMDSLLSAVGLEM